MRKEDEMPESIMAWREHCGDVWSGEWATETDSWCPQSATEYYRLPAAVTAPTADPVRDALVEALEDMLSGWIYIRSVHGNLSGVGWDRAQTSAENALALAKGEKT